MILIDEQQAANFELVSKLILPSTAPIWSLLNATAACSTFTAHFNFVAGGVMGTKGLPRVEVS